MTLATVYEGTILTGMLRGNSRTSSDKHLTVLSPVSNNFHFVDADQAYLAYTPVTERHIYVPYYFTSDLRHSQAKHGFWVPENWKELYPEAISPEHAVLVILLRDWQGRK